jgi:hypothetical protein
MAKGLRGRDQAIRGPRLEDLQGQLRWARIKAALRGPELPRVGSAFRRPTVTTLSEDAHCSLKGQSSPASSGQ